MANAYVLEKYYLDYLEKVVKVSPRTIYNYKRGLKKISELLVSEGKIHDNIYEIEDYDQLTILREYVFNHPAFIEFNTAGNRMYSSALNHYLRFAIGDEFGDIDTEIEILDQKIEKAERKVLRLEKYVRNSIVKNQVIESKGYCCEMDASHITFITKGTGNPYMEGHHAIPMKLQDNFEYSIDIYANIVCVCPICHRLLHYGRDDDKKILLNKIYDDRAERLANSGIFLSKEEFVEFAQK